MRLLRLVLLCSIVLMGRCGQIKQQETKTDMPQDPHSFSKPSDARVTHLDWKATIDFQTKTINAVASWTIEKASDANVIILDTKGLKVEKVMLNNNERGEFKFAEEDSLLGQALAILINQDTKVINIYYQTSGNAEALQWLTPQQTAGKKHAFLFTQSQAILARSWIPCQDSPSIRFTYQADVIVPKELIALMSASNPQQKNSTGAYHFEMKQPIPSYLLALAVGDVAFHPISNRSGVYAEPSMVNAAAWEFADLEKMIAGAEELYGSYRWERYDVIVLPPSFPFGGMENPRLTFATPTILAGDRSLTSLIAHELAHSWSGNLVTNATWNDFWLNEGFTVYFEHRIMEKLYGRDYAEMQATLALQDLNETIETFNKQNLQADTRLKLNLEGRNPDEGVTDIAYNKGYFFLRSMEEKYGREKFDLFINDYFTENAFKALDTDSFVKYIKAYFQSRFKVNLQDAELNKWIYTEGIPQNCPIPNALQFENVRKVLQTWNTSAKIDTVITHRWSTHEWLHFLKNLPETLTTKQVQQLDSLGGFTQSGNAEIITAWLVLAIRNQYTEAYPKLEEFLINTGRRKFLSPLYNELIKTDVGKQRAKAIYGKARSNYHFVATNTFDPMLL